MTSFKIKSGINLSHWISQVFGWSPRELFIKEEDIKKIASFGFDHVRIPFDEEELWHENGTQKEDVFQLFATCIEWCMKYNLKVIVDFHILRSHHFNNTNNEGGMTLWEKPEEQEKFLHMWTQLSEKLKHFPNSMLAYELMNEPVAPTNTEWNNFIRKGIAHVADMEPERTLLYGPNEWQMINNFPDLYVPEDKNILLSFHSYEPLLFTHYKAYWLPLKDYVGEVQYPGKPIPEKYLHQFESLPQEMKKMIDEKNKVHNPEAFEELFQLALDKSKQTGYQLYCGEFGCLPSVDRGMRLQYYKDITSIFKKHNIAYTHWDYKGDFGIVDWNRNSYTTGKADEEIIEILVG